jgi:hypothetical protein
MVMDNRENEVPEGLLDRAKKILGLGNAGKDVSQNGEPSFPMMTPEQIALAYKDVDAKRAATRQKLGNGYLADLAEF